MNVPVRSWPESRIVAAALEAGLADRLGGAAVDLALDDHRIDQAAEVVDGEVALDRDRTGVGIDLDLDDVAAIGEGEGLRIEVGRLLEPGLEVPAGSGGRIGPPGDLGEAERHVAAGDAEDAVLEHDVGRVAVEHVRGDPLHLGDDLAGRAQERAAADGERARAVGADAVGDPRRVAMDDLDLGRVEAGLVGDELGEGGLVALAVGVAAGEHRDAAGRADAGHGDLVLAAGAALLDQHLGRPHAAGLHVEGDAEAAAPAGGLRGAAARREARQVGERAARSSTCGRSPES